MKSFFSYTKLISTRPIHRTRFFQTFILMLIYFYMLMYFFNDNGMSFDIPIMVSILAIIVGNASRNMSEEINLVSIYPVSYKRRKMYELLMVAAIGVMAFITIIVLFLLMAGMVYIFSPESFSSNDGDNIINNNGIYFYGWSVAFMMFVYLLSSIKKDKYWWLAVGIGTTCFFLVNVLVSSILLKSFSIRNNLPGLIIQNNNPLWIYILSGFLFIVAIVLFFISISLKRPKYVKSN